MKETRRIAVLFWVSIIFLFLMSATILFMPLVAGVNNNSGTVIVGVIFWITAIAGYTLLAIAGFKKNKILQQGVKNKENESSRLGITVFFSNRLAKVADIMLCISASVFFILNFTKLRNLYISYILLFLAVFSLNMHSVFNGGIYKFIMKTDKGEGKI